MMQLGFVTAILPEFTPGPTAADGREVGLHNDRSHVLAS